MDKNGRYRNWLFTDFCEDCCIELDDSVKYCIYQREIAPTTGKLHYQGYIEFKEGKSFKNVSEYFCCKIHLEQRRGNQQQAIDYCSKLETRDKKFSLVEYGQKKNQDHRSDLDNIHESIMNGLTPAQILITHGGQAIKYINMINTAVKELWNLDGSVTKEMKPIKQNYDLIVNKIVDVTMEKILTDLNI